ncbi:MAG TPA: isoprenylcysteine carboxylmethyltransferase family protein [Nitrososphaerales archaeon]|nr:isoprenylcysteine carboxylmethyltransferase family protein [Nitrososphaerales archaeon]
MPRSGLGRAAAVAFPVILLIVGGTYAVAWLVVDFLGMPLSLVLPLPVKVVGWACLAAGAAVAGWVFRYRSPGVMIWSTHVTFRKMFGITQVAESSRRTERLVVEGPQKYTRNPLYFAVLLVVLGWGLAAASTEVLVWSAVLLAWFSLILIPFEENELQTLFGEQYARYAESVPMLVPLTKRKRPRKA